MSDAGSEVGLRSLEERIAGLPDLIRRYAEGPEPHLPARVASIDTFVTTGIGSSEAHARLLAHLLDETPSIRVKYVPLSVAATFAQGRTRDALVLFSQGLSPNARLALAAPGRWRHRIVATAARDADPEKRRCLDELRAAGESIVHFPGENEYATLVRITGPMAGYLAAHRIAEAIASATGRRGPVPPLDVEKIGRAIEAAATTLAKSLETAGVRSLSFLDRGLAFLAFGAYGELVSNLRYKILEGLFLPAPPVWDLLHFAHGPFQQAFPNPMTLLAFTRSGEPAEHALVSRLAEMLSTDRHRLVILDSALAGAAAIFEHEAMVNALLVQAIRERRIDQTNWPGKGRDRPLYEVEAAVLRSAEERPPRGPVRHLGDLTWPELEDLLAIGCRTAVVPLGSTEQHGPHLPFATDSWIADALAARFCKRVGEAISTPTIPIGCSSEHMGFPGTLDLRPETFGSVVGDVVASLAKHGFERVFLFSAHGGNYGALREALAGIRERVHPTEVLAFLDLERLTEVLHAESAKHGLGPEASGHHAGELETSILAAIRPHSVRRSALGAGFVEPVSDPQALFYPSLRDHAESGTVGDPQGASAEWAEGYLDAWAGLLVEAYRRAKNEK